MISIEVYVEFLVLSYVETISVQMSVYRRDRILAFDRFLIHLKRSLANSLQMSLKAIAGLCFLLSSICEIDHNVLATATQP
jgi:hypothetical protein